MVDLLGRRRLDDKEIGDIGVHMGYQHGESGTRLGLIYEVYRSRSARVPFRQTVQGRPRALSTVVSAPA